MLSGVLKMNCLQIIFGIKTVLITISFVVTRILDKHTPPIFKQWLSYGKISFQVKSSVIKPIPVPKSWFKHFYICSSVLNSFVWAITVNMYCFHSAPPTWFQSILYHAGGYSQKPAVSEIQVLLAVTLFGLHSIRRLYEAHYASVFSENGFMDLVQYIVALTHYTGIALAFLIEAPQLAHAQEEFQLNLFDLKLKDFIFTGVFLWACIHQHKVTVILGNLRKNKKGEIVSDKYFVPKGDLFEHLSSPHLVTEIVMYFSIAVILWGHTTWLVIFIWVTCNQAYSIILSHGWYQETFKDFPGKRKMFIPFVY